MCINSFLDYHEQNFAVSLRINAVRLTKYHPHIRISLLNHLMILRSVLFQEFLQSWKMEICLL